METIVEQACRICNNAKNRQNKMRDALADNIDFQIKTEHLLDNKILLVKLDEPTEETRSITGLIANKLMSSYGHPVMLLNKTFDEETGELVWAGSGRNNPAAGVESLQQLAKNSGYFTLAQGHDNALGLAIPDSNVKDFLAYSNELLKDYDFSLTYNVDIEFLANKIDAADILELADADYVWGQEVDEPLIALKNVSITKDNINLFGSTLKITLPDNIAIVKFKSSQEEFDSLYPGEGCYILDIVGRCMRNSGWDNGPEVIITDYNIVRKQEYYF
jgi:single-stranded-DNA-specific exonuclease